MVCRLPYRWGNLGQRRRASVRVNSTANSFSPHKFKGENRRETSATKPQLEARGSMPTAEQAYFRPQLEQRRERLLSALHSSADASLSHLLSEGDAALA